LLYTNDGPVILSHAEDQPTYLQPPREAIFGGDISPDGSEVLALSFQTEPTGITREPKILVIETDTGERATVVRVGPRGDLGPAFWSPDGARIAYRLTTYPVDPAKIHPGPHGDRRSHLCVLDLRTEFKRCFPDLRRVDGFDWAPDGQTLVVDVVGPSPLWLLEASTGRTSKLVPPHGSWIERAGLSKPVTFTSPAWSPSGRYVSAWVNNTPVVFRADGRLAAVGRTSREFTEALGWSPAEDLFAYVRGNPPYFTEIRLLNPETGEDQRLVSARGYPYITGLVWSPSGRWLAILRWGSSFKQRIEVIDVAGGQPPTTTKRNDSPVLIDWGP
jgi:Tol biopolymer transport system component